MDDVNRVPVAADPTQVSSTASSAWPLGAQASPAPEHGLFRAALAAPTACALAACFSQDLPRELRRVGVLISGGNIAMSTLQRLLAEHGETFAR
jgi:hypothetical protein